MERGNLKSLSNLESVLTLRWKFLVELERLSLPIYFKIDGNKYQVNNFCTNLFIFFNFFNFLYIYLFYILEVVLRIIIITHRTRLFVLETFIMLNQNMEMVHGIQMVYEYVSARSS